MSHNTISKDRNGNKDIHLSFFASSLLYNVDDMAMNFAYIILVCCMFYILAMFVFHFIVK